MIRRAINHWSTDMWTATNGSSTADATFDGIREAAEKLASMGPVLVRFEANHRGFIALRGFRKLVASPSNPNAGFQGVPLHESADYTDLSKPARVVAVLRDPNTGYEVKRLVYGASA